MSAHTALQQDAEDEFNTSVGIGEETESRGGEE
jgi:hypothetical protein